MNVAGRYVTKASLSNWQANPNQGDVPALHAKFELPTLNGPSEYLETWGLLDTGADVCVIPSWALGIHIPNNGSLPRITQGSIGARLAFRPATIAGVGGTAQILYVRARIKLASKQLAGDYQVAVCGNIDYPIIGRDVLNQFAGMLNPLQERICLSDGWVRRTIVSLGTFT